MAEVVGLGEAISLPHLGTILGTILGKKIFVILLHGAGWTGRCAKRGGFAAEIGKSWGKSGKREGGRHLTGAHLIRPAATFSPSDAEKERRKSGKAGAGEHRTSNIEHPTSNIQHRTSNIERPTSNIEYGGQLRVEGFGKRQRRTQIHLPTTSVRLNRSGFWPAPCFPVENRSCTRWVQQID